MRLKTRLFAGASTLALVGSFAALGATPAHAAPTVIGACTGSNAVAGIKNDLGGGITNAELHAKIGVKSIDGGTCSGQLALAGPIDSASLKASIVGFASCDTSLTPPGLPPNGKFGFTQAAGTIKSAGYIRFASLAGGPNYYSDVVGVHGMMTKGPYAGVDVDGGLFQNPTVKDKTLGSTFRDYVGLDVNPFDALAIGASCLSGSSTGNLLFNDNLSGGTKPVAVPTEVKTTLVGDGLSLLESTNLVPGSVDPTCTVPCVSAPGLVFSIF